jgi:glycosyltransferase involved in cell wall biosynthesis
MASRLPVVCTNVGGNPELVQDDVSGFLVPPGDSKAFANGLLRLLGNPVEMKRMGENARARACDLFDIERCVERTELFYRRVVTELSATRSCV